MAKKSTDNSLNYSDCLMFSQRSNSNINGPAEGEIGVHPILTANDGVSSAVMYYKTRNKIHTIPCIEFLFTTQYHFYNYYSTFSQIRENNLMISDQSLNSNLLFNVRIAKLRKENMNVKNLVDETFNLPTMLNQTIGIKPPKLYIKF